MDAAGNITGKGKYVEDEAGSREAQFMDASGKVRASQSRKMKGHGDRSVLYPGALIPIKTSYPPLKFLVSIKSFLISVLYLYYELLIVL
jgi:hypothetical protein